jgi:hypothetical protein
VKLETRAYPPSLKILEAETGGKVIAAVTEEAEDKVLAGRCENFLVVWITWNTAMHVEDWKSSDSQRVSCINPLVVGARE